MQWLSSTSWPDCLHFSYTKGKLLNNFGWDGQKFRRKTHTIKNKNTRISTKICQYKKANKPWCCPFEMLGPTAGLDNMRDPGILDPRHFFFPRHFYTIYAIFTRFTRFLHDFMWFLHNFTRFLRFLHDFTRFLRNFTWFLHDLTRFLRFSRYFLPGKKFSIPGTKNYFQGLRLSYSEKSISNMWLEFSPLINFEI